MSRLQSTFRADATYRPFFLSMIVFGVAYGLYKGIIDNYLAEIVTMTEFDKGVSEFFRELPGLALVLILAALYMFSAERIYKIGAVIMIIGMMMHAIVPANRVLVTVSILVYSLGDHMQQGTRNALTLEYAKEGRGGEALGLENSAYQIGTLVGYGLTFINAIGFSAMMHGYLPFGKDGELLTPFRTWRNTTTGPAAAELTDLFDFNIPQRWSIAHLYQAMLNGEEHVKDIDYLTTLAGYIHWKLTGRRVLGVGEASGMFPIDSTKNDFDGGMIAEFDQKASNYPWKLRDILPEVLTAGQDAGTLTFEGAKLLDPTGKLQPGIPLCPPEGDAGTGMAATNSVAVRTGNVSAGTSVFAMIVLEKALSKCYPEIDMVTTPTGKPVAMVHCNSCTSDLDAWVGLFGQFAELAGADISKTDLYALLYNHAMTGAADCGGMVAYNYFAGEPITGLDEGRPLFARNPGSMNLADFIRAHLYSSVATLKLGLDILFQKEHVALDSLLGHGGLFKTPVVGQRVMAAAAGVPVTVMETAGEGGPYQSSIELLKFPV